MSNDLALPEPRELAELETPNEAKELYDKIETIAQYAKRYRLDHEKQNAIAEAKLRIARKGGELLAKTVKPGNPQLSRDATVATLPEGFTRSMSSRWQMLASIPEERWEQTIAHASRGDDELTLDRMVRIGREIKLGGRSEKREQEARDRAQERPCNWEIEEIDLRGFRPLGVDAIVTDPPYLGDVMPLYEALRDFAVLTLPEGGALAVMVWQGILPAALRAFDHPELSYRWCLSWRYADQDHSTVDYARRLFDRWKPVLVYHRGAMPADAPMFKDEITSPAPDKQHHEWGQSLEGFEQLVRAISRPGDTICDPFLGGGTTALAALAQGRHFVGCDIDPEAVATAERRLPHYLTETR